MNEIVQIGGVVLVLRDDSFIWSGFGSQLESVTSVFFP